MEPKKKLKNEILQRKQASEDALETKREAWDKYEKLFHNQLADAISEKQASQVFDPKLSTLTLERGYRVMGQLATGKAKAISKNDVGTTMLMDLIVDKYVNPNANAQFDLLTKFRMTDIYSNVYGNFFVLVDWDVKANGYVGPDMWLLPIRDVFHQVGAVSPEDSDYMIVRSWKPLSFFENLAKQKSKDYKNLDKIIAKLKDRTGSKGDRDNDQKSQRELDQYPTAESAKKSGFFEVLSQYEGDRWVDYCVDADSEFRDTKNPHENGEIPIVCKYSIPLLDDFMGMGDFERGYSMQQVINSNWNLYLSAVKMSIFPPVILNKDNISSLSSIQYTAAAKWLARGNIGNVAQTLQLSPRGIDTFNNTQNVANGSLLNLFGTTDTTVTQASEAGFGKTPQALRQQQARENTRDNADRFYMEQFMKKVYKKFVNLIAKKQSSEITIRLFDNEIQDLSRTYPEIREMYDNKSGKLTIGKKNFGSTLFDYEIISGSTYSVDERTQQENLQGLIQMFTANPQSGQMLMQMLEQQGYKVNVGEMFKRMISKSGIQDWDKIIEEKTTGEIADEIFGQHSQQLQMAMSQLQGQTMGGVPQVQQEQQMQQDQFGQVPQF